MYRHSSRWSASAKGKESGSERNKRKKKKRRDKGKVGFLRFHSEQSEWGSQDKERRAGKRRKLERGTRDMEKRDFSLSVALVKIYRERPESKEKTEREKPGHDLWRLLMQKKQKKASIQQTQTHLMLRWACRSLQQRLCATWQLWRDRKRKRDFLFAPKFLLSLSVEQRVGREREKKERTI